MVLIKYRCLTTSRVKRQIVVEGHIYDAYEVAVVVICVVDDVIAVEVVRYLRYVVEELMRRRRKV